MLSELLKVQLNSDLIRLICFINYLIVLSSLKQKTLSGVLWSCVERFSVQGIQFVIMVIMARILLPSDYGMIGMLAIFIAIAQTLIDSGFSNALIQKKDRSEIDYSTVFYFNIAVGIVLYFILFFSSPLIARFYNTPELTGLTRVLALNLFINSAASSIIVRSAPKFVSNTYLNPKDFNAATILPVDIVPASNPNSSPIATLTEGAT